MAELRSTNPPVAVVTGASQGLGLALAEALADAGYALVIDARRADRLDAAVAALSRTAPRVVGVAGDVTDPEHRRALARAAAELGPVQLRREQREHARRQPAPLTRARSAPTCCARCSR